MTNITSSQPTATVNKVPFLITKGYQAMQKSESVRHGLCGISQFAMKVFFAIKALFRTEDRPLFKECKFAHPSRGRGPRAKI